MSFLHAFFACLFVACLFLASTFVEAPAGAGNCGGEVKISSTSPTKNKNFGKPLGTSSADPKNPLKAHSKASRTATLSEISKTQPEKLVPSSLKPKNKPALPGEKDTPIHGVKTSKNFITLNAVNAILMNVKKTHTPSKYVDKEDFGKVPKYLTKIKEDIHGEYEYIRKVQEEAEALEASKVRLMTDTERSDLLSALNTQKESVNNLYQKITHITLLDTITKIRNKERFEKELIELEKDIHKLKFQGEIYIDTTK